MKVPIAVSFSFQSKFFQLVIGPFYFHVFIIRDSCRSVCIRFLELSDANMPSNKGQWGIDGNLQPVHYSSI